MLIGAAPVLDHPETPRPIPGNEINIAIGIEVGRGDDRVSPELQIAALVRQRHGMSGGIPPGSGVDREDATVRAAEQQFRTTIAVDVPRNDRGPIRRQAERQVLDP